MEDHKEISVSLPGRLLAQLDLCLYDPATGRSEYGARSRLITSLLEAWLFKQSWETSNERTERRNTNHGAEFRGKA